MSRVVVIAASKGVRKRMSAMGSHELTDMSERQARRNLSGLLRKDPGIVVLGDDLSVGDAIALAERIAEAAPGIDQVLLREPEPDLVASAAQAGINDVLSPAAGADKWAELLAEINDPAVAGDFAPNGDEIPSTAARSDATDATLVWTQTNVTDLPMEPNVLEPDGIESGVDERLAAPDAVGEVEVVPAPIRDGSGRAIVIASPKGGVGKSTIAVNLALQLAKAHKLKVVLVDLDAQFGDVASLLDVVPRHTIVDAVGALGANDTVLLKSFLLAHPSGLIVLPAGDSPLTADKISADAAKELVDHLKTLFPIVIVDTGAGLTDQGVGALEAADEVVLVTSMDVAALRGLRGEREVLDALGVTDNRRLVINFEDGKSGLTVADVELVANLSASVVLPRDPEVILAGNEGSPLALQRRPGDVARSLGRFASELAGLSDGEIPRKERTK